MLNLTANSADSKSLIECQCSGPIQDLLSQDAWDDPEILVLTRWTGFGDAV